MTVKQPKLRNIQEKLLSDNWYILKNTPTNYKGAMAVGNNKSAKCMTGETVPLFCCTTKLKTALFLSANFACQCM